MSYRRSYSALETAVACERTEPSLWVICDVIAGAWGKKF